MLNITNDDHPSAGEPSDELIAFNLYLNDIDRLGNMIGVLGVGLVVNATDEVEEILHREQEHSISPSVDAQMNYEVAKTLANVNRIYLTTVLMFLYTSIERLNQFIETQDLSKDFNQERLRGREMVTMGDVFKMTGYMLAAQGFELIADSTLKENQLTPPP
ncbi:MAG: hypothetical protein WCP73_06155 [Eubacteriales bacterium]